MLWWCTYFSNTTTCRIILLNDTPLQKPEEDVVMSDISSKQLCERHSNNKLEYYCSEHNTVLCRACLVEGHCNLLQASYTIRAKTNLVFLDKMKCELMLTYDTPALRQTGSRNLTGQKMLPTIQGTYMKLVTKYQISAINSC